MLLHTSDLAYPGENPRPLNILQESRMMEKIAKMMELSKKQSSIFIPVEMVPVNCSSCLSCHVTCDVIPLNRAWQLGLDIIQGVS